MGEITILVPFLLAKIDNSGDQIEKIFAQGEKIFEFRDNTYKIIAKIRMIYIDKVQKSFLSV